MWTELAGQALGIGLGQSGQNVGFQQQDYYLRAHGASVSTPYSPISIDTSSYTVADALYIDDTTAEAVKLKVEEPPDEFTQLSNHKFHELLDRFYKLT